jgi:hypothetical protein
MGAPKSPICSSAWVCLLENDGSFFQITSFILLPFMIGWNLPLVILVQCGEQNKIRKVRFLCPTTSKHKNFTIFVVKF